MMKFLSADLINFLRYVVFLCLVSSKFFTNDKSQILISLVVFSQIFSFMIGGFGNVLNDCSKFVHIFENQAFRKLHYNQNNHQFQLFSESS